MSRDSVSIKKILVAVDGSKTSLDAAEHAICHAEKHDSELTALYVVSSDVRYGYLEDDQKTTLTGPFKRNYYDGSGKRRETFKRSETEGI